MDAIETILTRRSIRKYEKRPVEAEKLETILRAGMYAPSAHNLQPWEFLVVRDREKLMRLSAMQYADMLKQSDTAIMTLARTNDSGFFIQDCAAATENMLLAAHALGLGGVWLGLYGREEKLKLLREVLPIPEGIHPFSIVSLGYPAETRPPHTSFNKAKVHYETY